MKNLFNNLSELEKQRILEMHESKKDFLNEDQIDRMERRAERQTRRDNRGVSRELVRTGEAGTYQSPQLEGAKTRLSAIAYQNQKGLNGALTEAKAFKTALESEIKIKPSYASQASELKTQLDDYIRTLEAFIRKNNAMIAIKLPNKLPPPPQPAKPQVLPAGANPPNPQTGTQAA